MLSALIAVSGIATSAVLSMRNSAAEHERVGDAVRSSRESVRHVQESTSELADGLGTSVAQLSEMAAQLNERADSMLPQQRSTHNEIAVDVVNAADSESSKVTDLMREQLAISQSLRNTQEQIDASRRLDRDNDIRNRHVDRAVAVERVRGEATKVDATTSFQIERLMQDIERLGERMEQGFSGKDTHVTETFQTLPVWKR